MPVVLLALLRGHLQPKWLPHQRSISLALACFSDHLFLLRKGVPAQWLSFDVGTESIVDPIDGREGVGRGYDVDFPAVFKAKVGKCADDAVHLGGRYLYDWDTVPFFGHNISE